MCEGGENKINRDGRENVRGMKGGLKTNPCGCDDKGGRSNLLFYSTNK